jgi:hypothetical protein
LVADLKRAGARSETIDGVLTSGTRSVTRIRARDIDPLLWDAITQKMAMADAFEVVLEMSA